MPNIDEVISKSLNDIDSIIKNIEEQGNDLEKGFSPEPSPEEVSENTPDEPGEEGPEDTSGGEEGPQSEEGDTDTDNEGEEGEEQDEETEKSLEQDLNSNESVRKALEVSEFLQELVKSICNTISSHNSEVSKSIKTTEDSNMLLAKSFEGIVKSQKAVLETQTRVLKSINSLNQRLDKIESQPVARKSLSNKTTPIEKSFKSSVGVEDKTEKLSKSEAVTKLTSAFDQGNRQVMNDILALESTGDFGVLSDSAKSILNLK